MHPHAGFSQVDTLRWIALVSEAAAVARLLWVDQLKRFRWISALLILDLIGSLLGIALSTSSALYRELWGWRQPLVIVVYALAAVEVLGRLSDAYPNFGAKRKELVFAGAVIAAIAAGCAVVSDVRGVNWLRPYLQSVFIAKHAEAVAVTAWLGVVNIALAVAPMAASRNAIRHARVLILYALTDSVGYLAMARSGLHSAPIQVAIMSAQTVCFAAWGLAITKSGQAARALCADARSLERDAIAAERNFAATLGRATLE